MAKLTIKGLQELKGKRKITVTTAEDAHTARACELAGIDNIVAYDVSVSVIARAAPNTLITMAMSFADARISDETAVRAAADLMAQGADLIYTMDMTPERVHVLSKQGIPCVGHVGFIPYMASWIGGYKAVGKTALEAKALFDKTRALEEAGAIAVEMECVPEQVAAEITKRLKKILIFSMGSGADCDGQYLFSCDLLGSHDGHYPRHAKKYGNFFEQSVDILKQYKNDVTSGAYPEERNVIKMKDAEYRAFLDSLKR
ncbi:3-methyl-2-oxobutanoate hydroxymethyltransferase [Spirochaetia bacterium]|nr:3-methyl-2-oxobutanoate hydroxymethyltransferase [Spirochaetia bacterium]